MTSKTAKKAGFALSSLQSDPKYGDDGVWLVLDPEGLTEGDYVVVGTYADEPKGEHAEFPAVKLRSFDNVKAEKGLLKLRKGYNLNNPSSARKFTAEYISRFCWVGMRNFLDDEGKEIEYSRGIALSILENRMYRDFRRFLERETNSDMNFKAEFLEDARGN